jgi:hypothetical protein
MYDVKKAKMGWDDILVMDADTDELSASCSSHFIPQ